MLTKEQWEEINNKLCGSWGIVKLRVDGFDVCLEVRMVAERKYAIAVFVNGFIKGEDRLISVPSDPKEPTEIAKRFYQVHKRYIHPRKYRDEVKKIAKSRSRDTREFSQSLAATADSVMIWCDPIWNSFRALKRHLIKNNTSIELAPVDAEAKVG